jgi:predicted enzyme related to lactoylglutathione lyase
METRRTRSAKFIATDEFVGDPRSKWQAMSRPAPNSVVHLELHTADLRGAVDFYARLFGWQPERIRAGEGSYLALGMGDRVGGGVVECPAGQPLWLPYVEVRDVGATTDRAQGLGGEVLLGPREGPEGWRSVVSTPDGGEVAFWQPKGAKNGGR